MPSLLETIANWDDRASPSEAKYFFAPVQLEKDINGLTSGSKCFVVGSKGAGKSAVLEHIVAEARSSDIVIRNKFSPKNLKDFCAQTAEDSVRGADLELLWTYYICAKACLKLAEKKLGILRRFDLGAKYGLSARRSWWQRLWRVLPKFRRFKIDHQGVEFTTVDAPLEEGGGLALPVPRNPVSKMFLWGVHSDIAIEDVIAAQKAARVRVFVLFDEIDQAIGQSQDKQSFDDYLATVGALLSSVHSLRTKFNNENAAICPIVAIRNDIYEAITFSDKSALNSRKIDLLYKDREQLRPIIAHRISKALGAAGKSASSADFEKIWRKAVLELGPLRDDNSVYSRISRRTLNRPRDYVQYLKLAAIEQMSMKPLRKLIAYQAVSRAADTFSAFFLQEFKDEISFRYPKADRLVDVFRVICSDPKRNRFTFAQFEAACQGRGIEDDRGTYVDLAKHLFVVSVFGVYVKAEGETTPSLNFRYRDERLAFPGALDDPGTLFGLHTGFLRALHGD